MRAHTGSHKVNFLEQLRDLLREAGCLRRSSLLVGSSTVFPISVVGDFDIIEFNEVSSSKFISEPSRTIGWLEKKPVTLTSYPSEFCDLATHSPDLQFLLYREVRKIHNSLILNDDEHILTSIRAAAARIVPPLHRLQELLDKVSTIRGSLSPNGISIHDLHKLYSTIFIVAGYIYSPLGPTKSKWFWFHKENRFPPEITHLIETIVALFCPVTPPTLMHRLIREHIDYNPSDQRQVPSQFDPPSRSIELLIRSDFLEAAIFPFIELSLQCKGIRHLIGNEVLVNMIDCYLAELDSILSNRGSRILLAFDMAFQHCASQVRIAGSNSIGGE